jgi:hypothetical protein
MLHSPAIALHKVWFRLWRLALPWLHGRGHFIQHAGEGALRLGHAGDPVGVIWVPNRSMACLPASDYNHISWRRSFCVRLSWAGDQAGYRGRPCSCSHIQWYSNSAVASPRGLAAKNLRLAHHLFFWERFGLPPANPIRSLSETGTAYRTLIFVRYHSGISLAGNHTGCQSRPHAA